MPQFQYSAKSRTGERREGVLEAPDKRSLMSQLGRMGLVPISVSEVSSKRASPPVEKPGKTQKKAPAKAKPKAPPAAPGKKWFHFEKGFHSRPRMKIAEVLLFTSELSDLLSSGMTLGSALHALAQRQTGRAQDPIVTDLRDEIVQGASLSTALTRWPETFPTLYVSMVQAGEASGQLPSVLERLVKHFERVLSAREKVTMALVYPLIVALVGFGAMIFMMIFVIPRFSEMFESLGSSLPIPTQILLAISNGILHYGWALAIVMVVGGGFFKRMLKTPSGLEWRDRTLLRIPVVRNIVRANAFALFAHTLGTLLANGVKVLEALSIVENAVGNTVIAHAIRDAKKRVTDGSSISRPLAQGGIFPQLLTDMLAVGEESGDLSSALGHIAHRYDNELDRAVKIFTTVLEPVMMLLIAMGVGFVAISMLLAVFDLTSNLNA